MEKLNIMTLADNLATSQDKILHGEQKLDGDAIYSAIDSLGVLNKPVKEYFDMTQEEYEDSESDHMLTILKLSDKLGDLHDRILTNHVDGFVDKDEINFTYNHENPYEDDLYNQEVDLHVIVYGLKVIGAVQAIAEKDMEQVISKDAILSLGLATYALTKNAQLFQVGPAAGFLFCEAILWD